MPVVPCTFENKHALNMVSVETKTNQILHKQYLVYMFACTFLGAHLNNKEIRNVYSSQTEAVSAVIIVMFTDLKHHNKVKTTIVLLQST